jgi:hypothetical protein
MKVLMFGWEFPPHISGGLGTACYGLTKGLSSFKDIEIIFVVPKAYGDEDQETMKLIGAGDVSITKKNILFEDIREKLIPTRSIRTLSPIPIPKNSGT